MPRTYLQKQISIPPEEYEAAIKRLPYTPEIKTFSALVRYALRKLPKKA